MTAALTATSEGKSVVIVESQPVVGGNSCLLYTSICPNNLI